MSGIGEMFISYCDLRRALASVEVSTDLSVLEIPAFATVAE